MAQLKRTSLYLSEEEKKIAVWRKAKIHPLLEPEKYRVDYYGNLIRYDHYQDRNSAYGWEMHHITSINSGGRNDISNLCPLNHRLGPKWSIHYREW